MKITLPLDKMTTADKLAAMESLWEDLCHSPETIPSPPWHGTVLADREKQVREGSAPFSELDQAKKRIRIAVQ